MAETAWQEMKTDDVYGLLGGKGFHDVMYTGLVNIAAESCL